MESRCGMAAVLSPDAVGPWRRAAGAGPATIVAGAFDILHPGNLRTLREARSQGGRVCVLLAADEDRDAGEVPVYKAPERAEMVAHLRDVDAIALLRQGEADAIAAALSPYIFIDGDSAGRPCMAPLRRLAAQVIQVPRLPGCNTRDIHNRIAANRLPVPLPGGWDALTPRDRPGDTAGALVTVNGCFDILHIGHLRLLAQARAFGARLHVLINSDASVRRYKGATRPVFPAAFRKLALLSLAMVDAVDVFEEDETLAALERIRPAVHVKGGTFDADRVKRERELLATWGGRLEFCPLVEGHSTSSYITKALGFCPN